MLRFWIGMETNPKEFIGCHISLFIHCHPLCEGVTSSVVLVGISLFLVLEWCPFPPAENLEVWFSSSYLTKKMKGWSFCKTSYRFRISSRTSIKVFIKKKPPYCLIQVTEELGSLLLYHPITIGHYDMVSSPFGSAGYQQTSVPPNHSPSHPSLRKLTPCPPLITHLAFFF